jgi:hypothetical protein
MKKFLLTVLLFLSILLLIFSLGILLPPTPRAVRSLLFAKRQKDLLLHTTEFPRIIFIGGSNLSFGLNSEMIKDALNLNPINTGIHLNLGLIYMLNSAFPFIKEKDIVVVSPEYEHFYGNTAYGGRELLRTVLEVSPNDIEKLEIKQWLNIIAFLPKYSVSKFMPREYFSIKDDLFYGINSFNKYGDVYTHWGFGKQEFKPANTISKAFNVSVLKILCDFKKKIDKKKALMLFAFPSLQEASFNKNSKQIAKVKSELIKKGFSLLGTPEKYKFADSLMFNTPYHLSKKGMDLRTSLLIEDIKKYDNALLRSILNQCSNEKNQF